MKIYGWDDTGVARGEMTAANISASDAKMFSLDQIAASLGWEKAFYQFAVAKASLMQEMILQMVDPELIETVNSFKASYLTVVESD